MSSTCLIQRVYIVFQYSYCVYWVKSSWDFADNFSIVITLIIISILMFEFYLCGTWARVTERLLAYCRRLWMSTRLSYYCHCGARTGVAKRVPAFDSRCGVQTGVAKRVLAFDSHCGARMGVAKHVLAFDGLCGAWTGVVKTCNSLRQSKQGSNGGCQMWKRFWQFLQSSNGG